MAASKSIVILPASFCMSILLEVLENVKGELK